MILETVDLFKYFALPRGEAERGTLTCYRHTAIAELGVVRPRPALVIIPGGGYAMISERESETVALRYFQAGYDCFVLSYDVAPRAYPVQIQEAAMAMMYVRREQEALSLTGKTAVAGFSAGGHLAGCLTFLWRDSAIEALFGAECGRVRPDASLLCYPVVTADPRWWHRDSIVNFCGGDAALFEAYSLEKHVPTDAPPVFLWTTDKDDCVPPENAWLLYGALRRAHVSAELHVFEEGWHGLSLADFESNAAYRGEAVYRRAARWVDMSLEFLQGHGFCVPTQR